MNRPRIIGLSLTIIFVCLTAAVLTSSGRVAGWHFQVLAAQDRTAVSPPGPLTDFDIRAGRARALIAAPDSTDGRVVATQRSTVGNLQQANPRTIVRWSSVSGSASRVYDLNNSLSSPSRQDAEIIARDFLRRHEDIFHLPEAEVDRLRLARRYQTPHNGLTHLYLQQEIDGIEIFQGMMTLHLDRSGAVIAASGELYPKAARAAAPISARLTTVEALRAAVDQTGVAIKDGLKMVEPETGPSARQTISRAAGFARDVQARLVYFPLAQDQFRLAWEFYLWMRESPDVYLTIVDAENSTLLYRYNLTAYDENPLRPHGQVFTGESPRPNSPYTGNNNPATIERQDLPFQAAPFNGSTIFPLSNPHYDWWAGRPANNLISNNTDAHLDRDGVANEPDTPLLSAADGNFSFPLDFANTPTTANTSKAAQVNLFYWTNRYHDILYSFGFTEAAGNFQANNFNLGGLGSDLVQADAQDGGGINNANFSTPPDGQPGRMQMYLWNTANPQLDGDFDAGVIIHELTHGLSNRLVGNGNGLAGTQARGMGEGWSDFVGLVILRNEAEASDGSYPVGQYITNRPTRGVRRFPYSTTMSVNSLTYGQVANNTEVHAIGEIWCAALWEMRNLLVERYGFQDGQRQSLQMVVDGLKLTPLAPTFIDARDAILLADRVNNNGANQCLIWKAFAKRGLGFSATSTDSSDVTPLEAFDEAPYCSDTGTLSLNRTNYLQGETVRISLGDKNAGTGRSIRVTDSPSGDTEIVQLRPDETTTGNFTAMIQLSNGPVRQGDGALQGSVDLGDRITVEYVDDAISGGGSKTVTATAGFARERAIYEDDVEAGNLGWLPTGTWSISTTSSSSSSHSWRVSSTGNNSYLPVISLTSPLLDLTGVTDVTLNFAHSSDLINSFNYGVIEFSVNDGATWSRASALTGTQVNYALTSIRIPGLDGRAQTRFRFRLQNAISGTSNFWALDDITLTGRSGNANFIPPGAIDTPIITRITPAFSQPAGLTQVTIRGENFTESTDMALSFDGIPATQLTTISPGILTARIPAHAPGVASVRLLNRRGATSYAPGFTYFDPQAPPPAPVPSTLIPSIGSIRGGTSVTIYGQGFTPASIVSFGTTNATTTFVNPTTLISVTPTRSTAGSVDLVVQNGNQRGTLQGGFNFVEPIAPQLQILTPAGGETIYLGSTLPISWQSADNREIRSHTVQLINSSGTTLVTVELPGTAQSYNLPLTQTLTTTAQARIRVTVRDDEGATTVAMSQEFALQQRWVRLANLPQTIQRLMVASDGQTIYVAGGRTSTSDSTVVPTLYRYNQSGGDWATLAPMISALNGGDAAFLNGRIYIPGGVTSTSEISGFHAAYEISSNQWLVQPTAPLAKSYYSLASDEGRQAFHMTGGNTNSNIISATAHTFNPMTNSWGELTPMNVARHSHVSAIIEGKLYVAGGQGAAGGLTSAEVYDFTSKQWTPIASLNLPRLNASSIVTRDPSGNPLWFVVGGLNPITGLPLGAEVYDVRNDRWIVLDKSFNLGVPRTFFDGAVAGNFFYAVSGANPTTSINAVERIRIDTLTPTSDNQPPVLVTPATVIGIAGQEIKFIVQASDIGEPTPITIDLTNPPPGAEFLTTNPSASSATGEFRWTPLPKDTGTTITLTFKVEDGQFSETKVVRVMVVEAVPLVTVNAADFRQGPVAPDAIVAAFGTGFAVRAEAASTVPLPLEMSGTKVFVNGEAAPLFYVSPTQVNFVIPATISPGTASIVIVSPGGQYSFGQVTVNLAAPAIFTRDSSGSGEAAAQATPDGVTYQSSPFDILVNGRPNILLLYGTGIRRAPATNPGDGNGVAESVTATIDGKPAQVSYAGVQGNFSGLDQLNLEFPASLIGGPQRSVPVVISVNGLTANLVMITIK
jgi:uncharacterized protein (TIGR03437 family)